MSLKWFNVVAIPLCLLMDISIAGAAPPAKSTPPTTTQKQCALSQMCAVGGPVITAGAPGKSVLKTVGKEALSAVATSCTSGNVFAAALLIGSVLQDLEADKTSIGGAASGCPQ